MGKILSRPLGIEQSDGDPIPTFDFITLANMRDGIAKPVQVVGIDITENGEYEAPPGYAYSPANVNVSGGTPTLITKTITENGTYSAEDDDADGYSEVTVNVSGGISIDDIATNTAPSGAITLGSGVTTIENYAFDGKPITSITGQNVTDVKQNALQNTSITSIDDTNFPSLGVASQYNILLSMSSLQHIKLSGECISLSSGSGVLRNNANLISAEFPNASVNVSSSTVNMGANAFYGDTNLELVDIGQCNSVANSAFYNCNKLKTIIMRYPSLVSLANKGAFTNSSFKDSGTGGTIYIPKALYDHLGDGTSSDYQSASNWSTGYGWGTITWAKIEGSIYEL